VIGDNAVVTSTNGAIKVNAYNKEKLITALASASASTGSVGAAGTINVFISDSTTTAKVGNHAKLTAKDDKYACAIADKIISESQDTDKWYEFFDEFASLLNHPKSLVRNRVLYILSANAQWDNENRFDAIISDYLSHVTDDKPITARQCIKALAQVGVAKPQYIPRILSCFQEADLSKYKDSMRPLIERDMMETKKALIEQL
jgi:hypothetical protein